MSLDVPMMEVHDTGPKYGVPIGDAEIDACLAETGGARATHRKRNRSCAPAGLYVGRIPLPWLQNAIRAGRTGAKGVRTTETALALWFRAGCSKSLVVQLSRKDLELFCLNRYAYYRALRKLEDANLVNVQRARGRRVRVTILEPGGRMETQT